MQEVKKWYYKDKNGHVVGHVSRLESVNESDNSSQRKQIIPHFNEDGQVGIPDGFPAHLRVFGLHSLQDENEPIFFVEGEKCAHALHGIGLQAITTLGGSNNIHNADLSILDGFKTLYILPDNDEAGEKYAEAIYNKCRKLNAMPKVNVLRIPNSPEKGDVVDWLLTLESLKSWDGLSDLHNHPNQNDILCAFEKLYETSSALPPVEWNFIRTKQNLKGMDADSFSRLSLPERKALLKPIIMEASINMVYAPRGLGKTFFALSCSVAMAKGVPFIKYQPDRKASVLYLDGEMQATIMQERLRLLSGEAVPSNFYICTPDFQEIDTTPDLATAQGQIQVNELIEEVNADVIVIDNISTFMRSGNENDADSWSMVQPWLVKHRSKGRAILLIHHSNKSGDQRGTNKKEDVMDTVISLKRPDDYVQGEERTRILIQLTKARHIFGEDAEDVEAELYTDENCAKWNWSKAESNYDRAVMLLKEGILKQQEIAESLNVNKATITKWKKKAEAEGLL